MFIDVDRELDRLLAADQHDPFQVLGWQVIHRESLTLVIRAFQPRAQSMRLVLGSEHLEMYRMRDAGIFEIVLTGTGVPADYLFEVTYADRTVRLLQDPYRFPPQLTEFDQYLFGNGIHYELYNLMGAHLTAFNEVAGVTFRVWAPAARRVSVLGNFNDWDGRVHQMRCLGTTGIWELFIPDIAEGEAYKFEIKTRSGAILEKADPFQFHAELWPKSASIIQKLDYDWQDEQWLAARKPGMLHHRPISIYEVDAGSWQRDPGNPDRFLSFRELAGKLIPYTKEMGFTHIELLPVMADVRDDVRGFRVGGYFAPASRFGTPEGFMYFIDRCHQSGIGIILDWVPGHLPTNDNGPGRKGSLFEEEGHWQHLDGAGTVYRYQRKEMANFLVASILFWMDKYHVDGIRMEAVTKMLYRDGVPDAGRSGCSGKSEDLDAIFFLKNLNGVVAERFPGVLMIADERSRFFGTTREVTRGGLGFDFNWDAAWIGEILRYFCGEPHRRRYHHLEVTQSRPDIWAEQLIIPLSHKEVVGGKDSLLARMPGDTWQQFANLRLLLLLLWCQSGKKLLFMGNELGQLSEWHGQVSLDWHLVEKPGLHRQLQQYVKELNRFYLENPVLWENENDDEKLQWLVRGDAENSIVVFARQGRMAEDHLVCLLNFTPAVHHGYKMGVPTRSRYREVLCSDETRFGGSNVCNPHLKDPLAEAVEEAPFHVRVSVPPLGGLILKPGTGKGERAKRITDEGLKE
jgi:1,4-alpha-glucan branching enzyme